MCILSLLHSNHIHIQVFGYQATFFCNCNLVQFQVCIISTPAFVYGAVFHDAYTRTLWMSFFSWPAHAYTDANATACVNITSMYARPGYRIRSKFTTIKVLWINLQFWLCINLLLLGISNFFKQFFLLKKETSMPGFEPPISSFVYAHRLN